MNLDTLNPAQREAVEKTEGQYLYWLVLVQVKLRY